MTQTKTHTCSITTRCSKLFRNQRRLSLDADMYLACQRLFLTWRQLAIPASWSIASRRCCDRQSRRVPRIRQPSRSIAHRLESVATDSILIATNLAIHRLTSVAALHEGVASNCASHALSRWKIVLRKSRTRQRNHHRHQKNKTCSHN